MKEFMINVWRQAYPQLDNNCLPNDQGKLIFLRI